MFNWQPDCYENLHHLSKQLPENQRESFIKQTKEFNLTGFTVQNDSKEGHISYTIENIQSFDYEPLSPILTKFVPHVKFAANKFSLAGESGEANNWKEFQKISRRRGFQDE